MLRFLRIEGIFYENFINNTYSSVMSSSVGSPPLSSLYFVYGACVVSSCIG